MRLSRRGFIAGIASSPVAALGVVPVAVAADKAAISISSATHFGYVTKLPGSLIEDIQSTDVNALIGGRYFALTQSLFAYIPNVTSRA
jgi:hypothetical protein